MPCMLGFPRSDIRFSLSNTVLIYFYVRCYFLHRNGLCFRLWDYLIVHFIILAFQEP